MEEGIIGYLVPEDIEIDGEIYTLIEVDLDGSEVEDKNKERK